MLEAGVVTERHVHEAQDGKQTDRAFQKPSTEGTKPEHGAIVEGPSKN